MYVCKGRKDREKMADDLFALNDGVSMHQLLEQTEVHHHDHDHHDDDDVSRSRDHDAEVDDDENDDDANDDDTEEDVFQCGKCKQQFTSLDHFMNHKKICPIKHHSASTNDAANGCIIINSSSSPCESDVTTLTQMIPHDPASPTALPSSSSTSVTSVVTESSLTEMSHMLSLEPPSTALGSNVITLSESDILSLASNLSGNVLMNENSNPLNSESISILSSSSSSAAAAIAANNSSTTTANLTLNGSDSILGSNNSPFSGSQITFPAGLSFLTTASLNGTTFLVTTSNGSADGSAFSGDNLTISPNIVLNITTSSDQNHEPSGVSHEQQQQQEQQLQSMKPNKKSKKKNNGSKDIFLSSMSMSREGGSSGDQTNGTTSSNRLRCTYCERSFSKNFDLQQHIRCHTGEKPFQCVVCGRAFAQKSNVKKHMQTHKVWPDGLAHTLSLGGKESGSDNVVVVATTVDAIDGDVDHEHEDHFSATNSEVQQNGNHNNDHENHDNQQLTDHQTSSTSTVMMESRPEYSCPFCKMTCKTYFEFKSHTKSHKREKVYKCIQSSCGQMFNELDQFLQDIHVHEQDMTYRCHQCCKSFTDLNQFANHQNSHPLCTATGTSSSSTTTSTSTCIINSNSSNNNNNTTITTCTSSSSSPRSSLQSSLPSSSAAATAVAAAVAAQKYFRCQKCLNKYTTPAALEHHLATSTHHYPCPQCHKVFPCERYLRRHLVTHGSGLHECHYCDKTFKTANYLKVHLVIHTGVKPYVCNICPAAFNRRDKLKRHKLVHDPVKKFKCPFRNHTGCSKEFNRPDKLKAHMLTHAGVKPHQCSLCGRSFSRRAHLRAHAVSHTITSNVKSTMDKVVVVSTAAATV